MRSPKAFTAIIAAMILGAAPLAAFTLEPMSTLLAPTGTGSVATFRVKNPGAERIAIKASVVTRQTNPDGTEVNLPATELFMVYPARLVVEAGATSNFKVQWKGQKSLDKEQCFRVIVDEIPINVEETRGAGFRILFRYVASLYVGRESFEESLSAKVSGSTGTEGQAGFLVEIANSGTRHVVVMSMSLELNDSKEERFFLSNEELGVLNGANYLPDQPLRLFIPSSKAVPGELYDARIVYKGEH